MNLKQLEAFRGVMIAGSMVGAAKLLHVSQPAISQIINQLEREIGFALFKRQNGRVYATPEAELLLSETERVYAGVKDLERLTEGLRLNKYGSLRLAGFPAISRAALPRILSTYQNGRPDIHVSLQSMPSRNLANMIARREIDLALSALPSDRDEVTGTVIGDLRTVCVLPNGHPLCEKTIIHATDLAGEAFISLGKDDPSRPTVDKVFDTAGVQRRLCVEVSQSDVACGFVAERYGIAIVDEMTMSWYRDDKISVRPFEPEISFKIWLLELRNTRRPRLLNDFSQYLKEETAKLLEGIQRRAL